MLLKSNPGVIMTYVPLEVVALLHAFRWATFDPVEVITHQGSCNMAAGHGATSHL